MRAFISIVPPKELREKLSKVCPRTLFKGTFVAPENIQLDLRFLGNIQEDIAKQICKFLKNIANSWIAFKIKLNGIGVFPSEKRPRVVWIGVSEGLQDLICLNQLIEENLQKIGFEKGKKFKPHITLARIKYFRSFSKFLDFLKENEKTYFGEFLAKELILFKSTLTPKGPIYEPIFKAKFKNG